MKKLLLSLGTLAAVAVPVTTVVACGSSHNTNPNKGGALDPNGAAHAKETGATSVNGTQANNVAGENLERPFVDIADSQDENTVYQPTPSKVDITGELIFENGIIDLTKDAKVASLDKVNVNTVKFTVGTASGSEALSFDFNNLKEQEVSFKINATDSGFFLVSVDKDLKIHLGLNPKFVDKNKAVPKDLSFVKVTKTLIEATSIRYWASKIPSHLVPVQFKWNADECHSIADIIKQMDSQLHFNFQLKLESMTPLNFADYITNLIVNNGGGKWDFKVNYKGHSDDVNLNPAPVLNRFLKALDGDSNPKGETGERFKAISDETEMSKAGMFGMMFKANWGPFINMLTAHANVLPKDLSPVFALMGNFPNDALNVFPDFLELFMSMGKAFKTSPVAQAWAHDQSSDVQDIFFGNKEHIIRYEQKDGKDDKDRPLPEGIPNEIIKTVLSSGN